jgi:AraC-like DNA-binding protein
MAKQLLATGSMSVTEICLEVGYGSLGSFSSRFRAIVGRTPTEYQREVRRVFGYSAPWRITFMPVCYLAAFAGLER